MSFTNKNKLHKILIFILILLICVGFSFSSNCVELPTVDAPSCILMDLNSDKILYSKNVNEKMYPASTTKVMTAILAMENCNLTDVATVSHGAIFDVPVGYANANLQEGEELTIDQLLHVLLIPSANDAAFVIAEHIGGTREHFYEMMNEKAIELGCKNTHFTNPNGIHSEDHYTTAYDLALMGQYAMKFDVIREIAKTTFYRLPATNKYDKDDRVFATTIDLIKENHEDSPTNYYYEYATGLKTGYTDAAKHCIIATAKKGDVELLVVILGDIKDDEGINHRPKDCKTLFEYGFNNYSPHKIISAGDIAKTIDVKRGSLKTRKLDLRAEKDVFGLTPNNVSLDKVIANIKLNENITAPITEGTVLGTISYTVDNATYTTNLIATHDVEEFDYNKMYLYIALAVVILILLRVIKSKSNKNKRNKKNGKKGSKNNYKKYTSKVDSNFYPRFNA